MPTRTAGQLADYVGQPVVAEQMEIFVSAARARSEALDHTLIFGPPGLGKTTLAHIIATEMGVNMHHTSGPMLERPGDLAALLTKMLFHAVLIIQRLGKAESVNSKIKDVLKIVVCGPG